MKGVATKVMGFAIRNYLIPGRRLLAVLMLSATATALAAPDSGRPSRFKVNPLHLESGPGRDWAYTVRRDATGYLWVGTDNGLKRYDGYNFTAFSHNPDNPRSIGSNTIYTLLIDPAQTLWIGGRMLSVFNADTETFDNYPLTDNNIIWGMAIDTRGILWLGAEKTGLIGFDMSKRQAVYRSATKTGETGIPNTITEIINDRKDPDLLWMTATNGLFRFDSRTHEFSLVLSSAELNHASLVATSVLKMDREGKIWISSESGLFVVDPEKRTYRHYTHRNGDPHALSTNILTTVFIDSRDRIWIGTDKEGAHVYRPETDDFIHIPASTTRAGAFGPANITEIYEDDGGSLWFSVGAFGVQRISQHLEKFVVIDSGPDEHQLSWDLLLDLLEDRNGHVWIATDGGGLNRYDPATGKIARYLHEPGNPQSLSSNSVISLAEDRHGRIWVGTWAGGLNRLDPATGNVVRFLHDPAAPRNRTIGNNNVFQIVEDDGGWLWLSLWNFGLQRFDPATEEFMTFHYNDPGDTSGLTNGSINAVEPSRYGHIWIGHYQGLQKYEPGTQRFSRVSLGKATLEILDIYEEQTGVLWIGTTEGLIRYHQDAGGVRQYTVADGLSDPFVASIEQDGSGRLWLGTRGGLSLFDPERESFETFDKFDGLPADEFNRYSHLLSRDGTMYFGGTSGLVLFNPENLPRNARTPNVVLTGLDLFQRRVVPGDSPYLPRHIRLIHELILPYEQRDITFEFSALDFISPIKNRYRYRLQGLEENWTEVDSSRRRARYTNLEPGRYQFQVSASNNDGVWNQQGARLDLMIVPLWWMTWWAKLLAAALGLYAAYGFGAWRLRISRQRERALSIEIEERRAAESKLFHIAYHDALTNLPNRLWLLERLDEQIARVKADPDYRFALMFLDGDRFKQINDTHGHQLGDFILVSAAKRLQAMLPGKYLPARLGGDEFTVLVENAGAEDETIATCERILRAFSEPFQVEKSTLFFKVSIGVVFCGAQYAYPGQILRDADIAMYKAKERGRGTYQIFDSQMREQTLETAELEADLYKALEHNQFFLAYQPIVNLQTGRLSGFEALVRWRHPEKGLIPPDKFIPVAEESGLIFSLGSWVLHQACAQLGAWIREYGLEKPPTMAVNLSSLQLSQPDFLAQIDNMLTETGIDARLLKLELTESTLMENIVSVNLLLDELRARRIELAIDDFGTGYSSLSYLDRLPVQVLKIDRKFVDGIIQAGEGGSSVEIVKATISLAHNLNIRVVAEGIETEQQYRLLKSYGCDFGQGYYIARPLSSQDAARFMGHEPDPGTNVRVASNSDITGIINKPGGLRRRMRK